MQRTLLILVAMIAAGTSVWTALEARRKLQAEVRFDPAELDCGEVLPGTHFQARVRLVNETRQPVRILHIHTSCGCADVRVSESDVLPRGAAYLEATWRVPGRNGAQQATLAVTYVNRAGVRRVAVLRLRALVVPKFELSATRLVFEQGRSAEQRIRLVPTKNTDVRIRSVAVEQVSFQAEVIDPHQVRVLFDPSKSPLDESRAFLDLTTTTALSEKPW